MIIGLHLTDCDCFGFPLSQMLSGRMNYYLAHLRTENKSRAPLKGVPPALLNTFHKLKLF